MPLTDVVFNTEAHAFPRFELGKLFKTGWERRPRDESGKLLPVPEKKAEENKPEATKTDPLAGAGPRTIQTVHLTSTKVVPATETKVLPRSESQFETSSAGATETAVVPVIADPAVEMAT